MADTQLEMEGKTSKQLLQSGGKAFATQDYASAVQFLSKASEVGVKEHDGDAIHDDLGELYLLYGRALLEFTRMDGDPLGEDVPKDVVVGTAEEGESDGEDEEVEEEEKIDDDDDSEGDEGEDNAKNEEEEKVNDGEKAKEEEEKVKDGEKAKEGEEKGGMEGAASGIEFNGEKSEEKKEGEEVVEDDAEDVEMDDEEAGPSTSKPEDEEPSDLEVAWECLELAKGIFSARGDAGKSYLADTLIALGEISLENENVEGGLADISEALEIQKTLYDDSSRVMAETHYKLGMAYAMGENLTTAIENFQRSIELLQNRIKKIESSEKTIHKEEIEDIKKLLPEIEDKIKDCKEMPEEKAVLKDAVDPQPTLPSSPEKKATDISHLVKRKRKSEEGESSGSVPKKPALE